MAFQDASEDNSENTVYAPNGEETFSSSELAPPPSNPSTRVSEWNSCLPSKGENGGVNFEHNVDSGRGSPAHSQMAAKLPNPDVQSPLANFPPPQNYAETLQDILIMNREQESATERAAEGIGKNPADVENGEASNLLSLVLGDPPRSAGWWFGCSALFAVVCFVSIIWLTRLAQRRWGECPAIQLRNLLLCIGVGSFAIFFFRVFHFDLEGRVAEAARRVSDTELLDVMRRVRPVIGTGRGALWAYRPLSLEAQRRGIIQS